MKNLVSKKYQILEHPADLKIKVYGKDLAELLNNVLQALNEATEPKILDEKIETEIEIKSENLENLFVDFLSEVIYQTDLNNAAYLKAKFEKLTEKELKGKIFGQKIKSFQTEVKAVTWHDLEIKKENSSFFATVVFDI
ncbi:MAG: archease [Patescibacteria group bacterium]|nr:archease [Patescibacteria group bacterium]